MERKRKKYYDNNKIKFEGEYLNRLKWNGIISLEIKNGKGKGREYNKKGKLIFEGEYINGKKKEE